MTDLIEKVAEKVRQLPSTQQQEVLNFVEFLQHKHFQTDKITEDGWLAVASKSPALEFLHDEAEDVYGFQDGKPYTP
jgi:Protein of unknown function (DUF2281)